MRLFFLFAIILHFLAPGESYGQRKKQDGTGYYALVAGGSKGIGYAVAEALAKRNFNLILIARHVAPLHAVESRLETKYNVQVEILSYDLSKEGSAEAIAAWCTERNIPLKVLCNVAGLGGVKDFLAQPLDTMRYMIDLNVASCMAMTQTLLPLLEKNKPAYVMNVASMAGFAPIPSKNMYSATKSAVIFFSYSLRNQLRKKDIRVSCLAPGPVFTKPTIEEDTKSQLGWFGRQMAVSPERVGEVAIRKTLNGRMMIVPGTLAKTTSIVIRALPHRWAAGLYHQLGSEK